MNRLIPALGPVLGLIAIVGLFFVSGGDTIVNEYGAQPGPESTSEYFCNVGVCTWTKTGVFMDATTTVASIANPFNATSTVVFAVVDITGLSTTTLTLKVGTSTNVSEPLASGVSAGLMNVTVPTSTIRYFSTADAAIIGQGVTMTSMQVGPSERVLIHASSTNSQAAHNAGILDGANTFNGKYIIRFVR